MFCRNQNGFEYPLSDEEEEIVEEEKEEEDDDEREEEERCFVGHRFDHRQSTENDHLVADIIRGGEALFFLNKNTTTRVRSFDRRTLSEEFLSPHESIDSSTDQDQEDDPANSPTDETLSVHESSSSPSPPRCSEYEYHQQEDVVADPVQDSVSDPASWTTKSNNNLQGNDKSCGSTFANTCI